MHKKLKLKVFGVILILLSVTVAVLVYGRLYLNRWQRQTDEPVAVSLPVASDDSEDKKSEIIPVSLQFGLAIPKLNLNVPVIANVDGTNSNEYYTKLQTGVAHEKGTPLPDSGGNTVIFGHSSKVPGYKKTDFSEIFLTLDSLQQDDEILIWYNNVKYSYLVAESKIVPDTAVEILNNTSNKQLTLYTCWPPGTNKKRLVVIARAN